MRVLSFIPLLSLALSAFAAPTIEPRAKYDTAELNKALKRGVNILGSYKKCSSKTLCSWMSKYADSTSITDMSIPGTHDTATWGYTEITQLKNLKYTGVMNPAIVYRCQSTSIFEQLNAGHRAFDLRVGFSPDNSSVIFYHSEALLDPDATIEDVMYGFYRFLEENPTETLLVSVKVDNTTWGTPERLQQHLYTTFTSFPATSYVDASTSLSSRPLSAFRGKLILLRRFALDHLPAAQQHLGLDVSSYWNDNDADFTIPYSTSPAENAYIEDYYEIGGPLGLNSHATWKYNATVAHIAAASKKSKGEGLYVSFASAEKDTELLFPKFIASGVWPIDGVNARVLKWLTSGAGKGLKKKGIVLTDWAEETSGLVEAIIA
ncbi:hypothetical protein IAT38_003710 [Cryptococcus sp. DSM 104549]